jgi:hypothetical protein
MIGLKSRILANPGRISIMECGELYNFLKISVKNIPRISTSINQKCH